MIDNVELRLQSAEACEPCQTVKKALLLLHDDIRIVEKLWSARDVGNAIRNGDKPRLPLLELYVQGRPLATRVGRCSSDPAAEAVSITAWIAQALDAERTADGNRDG